MGHGFTRFNPKARVFLWSSRFFSEIRGQAASDRSLAVENSLRLIQPPETPSAILFAEQQRYRKVRQHIRYR